MVEITRILAANIRRLDTCIMQTMLPQAIVVYEVSWHDMGTPDMDLEHLGLYPANNMIRLSANFPAVKGSI